MTLAPPATDNMTKPCADRMDAGDLEVPAPWSPAVRGPAPS